MRWLTYVQRRTLALGRIPSRVGLWGAFPWHTARPSAPGEQAPTGVLQETGVGRCGRESGATGLIGGVLATGHACDGVLV